MTKKKLKIKTYEAHPQFATEYYGLKYEQRPKGWYKVRAENKEQAIKKFAKRYHRTQSDIRKYGGIKRYS